MATLLALTTGVITTKAGPSQAPLLYLNLGPKIRSLVLVPASMAGGRPAPHKNSCQVSVGEPPSALRGAWCQACVWVGSEAVDVQLVTWQTCQLKLAAR